MTTATNTITVRTEVAASPLRTWELWNDPQHIVKWNYAIDSWHCPSASGDLRPGGTFSVRMEAKDGSMGFDFGGTYDVVKPGELLTYTMGDGRRVEVHFREKEGGTEVVERFEPETQNSLEMQQGGWQAILDNFKRYAEAQGA